MRRAALVMVLVACGKPAEKAQPATRAPDAAPTPDAAAPKAPTPTRDTVSVGSGAGCARTSEAKLACWGGGFGDRAAVVSGFEKVAGVATAQGTTCAWTTEGAVLCTSRGEKPIPMKGIDDAIQVATDPDAFEFCARRRSGAITCWRELGTADERHDVEIKNADEIAVAGTTVCARTKTSVACADGNGGGKAWPVPTAEGATRLGAGRFRFVALRGAKPAASWDEQGKAAKLPALDRDTEQVAIGGDDLCARGARTICWHTDGPPKIIAGAAGAREVSVGWGFACAAVGAQLRCWGQIGSLGDGTPFTSDVPVLVKDLTDAVQVEGNDNSERTCARRATGATVCWGTRKDGGSDAVPVEDGTKLEPHAKEWTGGNGRGSWDCTKKKGHVACEETYFGRGEQSTGPEDGWGNLDDVRDIRMPNNESGLMCIADAAGAVSCYSAWDARSTALTVDGLTDVVALVPYAEATCALERGGTVKCWNEREREAKGGKVAAIAGITDAVELTSGSVHACARHETGTVSCWGVRQMLGDGADVHQIDPVIVPVSL